MRTTPPLSFMSMMSMTTHLSLTGLLMRLKSLRKMIECCLKEFFRLAKKTSLILWYISYLFSLLFRILFYFIFVYFCLVICSYFCFFYFCFRSVWFDHCGLRQPQWGQGRDCRLYKRCQWSSSWVFSDNLWSHNNRGKYLHR